MTWELFYGFSISSQDLVAHIARRKGLLGDTEVPTRDTLIQLLTRANLFPRSDYDTLDMLLNNEEMIHDLFCLAFRNETTLNLAINYNDKSFLLGRSILYLDSRAYRHVTPFKDIWNENQCQQIRAELERFGCSKNQLDACELLVIKHDTDSSSGF